MNDKVKVVRDASPSREELRAALLKGQHAKSEVVTLFGQEVEVRQPSLGAILDAREDDDPASRGVTMIINYAYVPGTNERLFDEEDAEAIKEWPFSDDLLALQDAIARLTGVDIGAAEEELDANPLEGQS